MIRFKEMAASGLKLLLICVFAVQVVRSVRIELLDKSQKGTMKFWCIFSNYTLPVTANSFLIYSPVGIIGIGDATWEHQNKKPSIKSKNSYSYEISNCEGHNSDQGLCMESKGPQYFTQEVTGGCTVGATKEEKQFNAIGTIGILLCLIKPYLIQPLQYL